MAQKPNSSRRRRKPETNPRKKRRIVYKFKEDELVDYKDVALLRKFMSDRGKIRSRRVTGLSPHRQREIAIAIKNAREMALLPYVAQKRSDR